MKTLSIAEIFRNEFGVDYNTMKEWEVINVENFNKKIRSFNPMTKQEEFNLIKNIVRKPNSKAYLVKCGSNEFECSSDHKIAIKFDKNLPDFTYMTASQLKKTGNYYMYINNCWEEATVKSLNKEIPILDIEVENTHNYFANGILSHNTMFGSPETTPGGQALKFFSSVRLDVRKAETSKGASDEDDALGIVSRVKCIKNKTAVPFRKVEMKFDFKTGVDIFSEYIDFAVSLGIVDKKGAWYAYKEEKLGQGSDNVKKFFKENPTIFEEVKIQVDKQLSNNFTATIESEEVEEVQNEVNVNDLASLALVEEK